MCIYRYKYYLQNYCVWMRILIKKQYCCYVTISKQVNTFKIKPLKNDKHLTNNTLTIQSIDNYLLKHKQDITIKYH